MKLFYKKIIEIILLISYCSNQLSMLLLLLLHHEINILAISYKKILNLLINTKY